MHQPTTPVRMELKYCERCGSLWLRPEGCAATYCAPCAREMAGLPRRPLPPTDVRAEASLDDPDDPPARPRGRPPGFLTHVGRQVRRPEIARPA